VTVSSRLVETPKTSAGLYARSRARTVCGRILGSKQEPWSTRAWVFGFLVSFVSSRYSVTADASDLCPFLLLLGTTSTPLFTALISAPFLKRRAFAMRAAYELARGIDDSDVSPGRPTQSVSVDDTFETTAYLSFGLGPLRDRRWLASLGSASTPIHVHTSFFVEFGSEIPRSNRFRMRRTSTKVEIGRCRFPCGD
jgi:hypothetical protein